MSPISTIGAALRRRPQPIERPRPSVVLPDRPAPDAGRLAHDDALIVAREVPPQRRAEPAGCAP